jgi:subtilisin family serine protease
MLTFAVAAQQADATGLPVVEGFAVKLEAGTDEAAVTAKLEAQLPGYAWTARAMGDGWWMVLSGGDGSPAAAPLLGAAWEAVRALTAIRGVDSAEPLLLTRSPVTNGSEAGRAFRLWGKVSDDRLAQIKAASSDQHRHWSLEQMVVCDANGQHGAWAAWRAKPGNENKTPGEGVLVAHPDTGYTRHARLLPHLQPHPDNPARYGKNFVERAMPDGFDPMQDRTLGNFPGHGTGTASVIAAGSSESGQPWGVAPGAKILPLRVSSSVIHLSFRNVCDALAEAIDRGAHVISMSLGGPLGSGLLSSLVRRALDQGIIIVSAAGNFAPTVVFPAAIHGVLACAASNALRAPWRFSGLGTAVAISAPGELVWHDWERIDGPSGQPVDDQSNGSGTSFATANVAGLAALWLSYHGRDALIAQHCDDHKELLPFLFRLCLQRSSDHGPPFIRGGSGGFGAGIARADKLLALSLPSPAEAQKEHDDILSAAPGSVVSFPVNSWWTILNLPTLAEDGPVLAGTEVAQDKRQERLDQFLTGKEGLVPGSLAGSLDNQDRAEIATLAAADVLLAGALARIAQGGRNRISAAALRRYLLRPTAPLSQSLRDKLTAARAAEQQIWSKVHPELAKSYPLPSAEAEERKTAYNVMPPPTRRLRAFAFDPSLATRSADAAVNEIIVPVVFERRLEPGPVGDYLEVVDVDPASDCAYAPVDLNHPFLLAQDGLPRSEGNPQFHQQMVYAVAMKTISHFEEALGRPIFWSPLRPWDWRSGDKARAEPRVDPSDQFVQRLRLYPHALRDQNAYYSPQKRAILFGYFPAGDGDPGTEYPGGVVFTCLAHDIIAHETTHAILDGMHVRFIEPTNPDVFAFHEAFADIVALFQRFTYAELLRDQIARARGRLDAGTLMTRLALQFGQATGRHQALRDALGHVVRQGRARGAAEWRDLREKGEMDGGTAPRVTLADAARDLGDEETRYLWKRFQADPSLLAEVMEPHERGSFLVAAVFDAYLSIYEDRVADLKRIATGGTGVLPEGNLHPDLVQRMASEAAKSSHHVLRMCLRAMDYVPPTDITFGEFLRAVITADLDLVPDDDRRYRIAFIEAFRKWGIYPRDVRTLSEETLRWSPPDPQQRSLFPGGKQREVINLVRRALFDWQPGEPRDAIFANIKKAQRELHHYFQKMPDDDTKKALLGGIDTTRTFQVANLRPARRIGPRGEFLTEMVVEILQQDDALPDDEQEKKKEEARRAWAKKERKQGGEAQRPSPLPFRGGVTLIVGMDKDDYIVRYAIQKRFDSVTRKARQRDFLLRAGAAGSSDAAEYSSDGLPAGWDSQEDLRRAWFAGRTSNLEDMRASSCDCRSCRLDKAKKKGPPSEPFALLHRS